MQFEYTQLYFSFKDDGINHLDKLNKLGKDQWELISIVKIDHENIMYIFKRELQTKNLLN